MAEGVGGAQFVAVVLQRAAVEEAIVRGSLATLAGRAGRVDALVVLVVPGVLVEHGGGQAQGLGGRVGDAGFQGAGAFRFQVVVGNDAATAGQHGFVQARAARGIGQAGIERHLFVQVIDGGNAGVDLSVGDFAAAGGAHLEVVVAQAGGEGDGVQVPDAFGIDAVVGLALVDGVGGRAVGGQAGAGLGFLTAQVDAVFQDVLVEQVAVQVDVGALGFHFTGAKQQGTGACAREVLHFGAHPVDIGLDLVHRAQAATGVGQTGGVLGVDAVARGVVGLVVVLREVEFFAQGAHAVGLFLAVAQFDAVLLVQRIAELGQQAALSQGAVLHFALGAAAGLVVLFLRPVGVDEGIQCTELAIGGHAGTAALVAAEATVDLEAQGLAGTQQVLGRGGAGHDGAAGGTNAGRGRAGAFLHFDVLDEGRIQQEAAVMVEHLRVGIGVVDLDVDLVLTHAADGDPLRGAVAAAEVDGRLGREHFLHFIGGAFFQRLEVDLLGGGGRLFDGVDGLELGFGRGGGLGVRKGADERQRHGLQAERDAV